MNKTYELPKIGCLGSRRVVAEFDEYGIAKITEQALDSLICELNEYAKRQTGEWIMSEDGLYRPLCDKCGAHPWKGYIPTVEEATEVFKYCPNCGARMVEPKESEE